MDDLGRLQVTIGEADYELLAAIIEDILTRDIDEDGNGAKNSQSLRESVRQNSSPLVSAAAKLHQLKAIWEKYKAASSGPNEKHRHNLLFGPSYGVPFTEDVARNYLLGVTAEVGGQHWGLSANAGLRHQFDNALPIRDAVGWYFGVGLSGELTDDLLNLLDGAATAGAKLKGAHAGQ
jgi:hypothetical protein